MKARRNRLKRHRRAARRWLSDPAKSAGGQGAAAKVFRAGADDVGVNMNLETDQQVSWNLAACARIYGVTIREIARHMSITLKRVREVRDAKTVPAITAWNFCYEIKTLAALKASKAQ